MSANQKVHVKDQNHISSVRIVLSVLLALGTMTTVAGSNIYTVYAQKDETSDVSEAISEECDESSEKDGRLFR